MARVRGLPIYAVLLLPGLLVLYFSFHAGGYFPRQVAIAGLVVTQVLILFLLLTNNPFERLSWPAVAATVAMALFAGWILLSQLWSDSPARSILEFDRALMYLVALLLFTFIGGRPERLRFATRIIALAIAIVGICALITRLAPDVWPTEPNLQNNRLSWPLTYWNALGILVAFGTILCFHLACCRSEPRVVRVLGAAAVPVLATTVFFTFSRGPMWAGAIGLIAYVVAGRPRALLTGAVATVPATFIALTTAYDQDLLATSTPTTAAAQVQGHHVARVVIACVIAAAIVRALLLLVDERRSRTVGEYFPVRVRQVVVGLAAAVVVVAGISAVASGDVNRAYHRVADDDPTSGKDFRARLTSVGSAARIEQYRASNAGYRENRLHGTGAGTYDLTWQQFRPRFFQIVDAHSLYIETLGEMGIVGFLLIGSVVLALLATALARSRGADRAAYGVVFGAGLAWAIHAGVDWDWEMPATTLPVIALGGLALGSARSRLGAVAPSPDTRLAMGLCCVACLLTPILVIGSQSRLNDGLGAFQSGSCPDAVSDVRDSLRWIASRTEAYQVMAYCQIINDYPVQGLQAAEKAHRYDPHNWETDAWLAVAQAAAGQDPRPAIQRAVVRNPKLTDLRQIRRYLDGSKPSEWRANAGRARRALASTGQVAILNPH
jgi:hypothetical protein